MAERIEQDAKSQTADPRLTLIAAHIKALEGCDALRDIAADPGAPNYLLLPLLEDRSRRG